MTHSPRQQQPLPQQDEKVTLTPELDGLAITSRRVPSNGLSFNVVQAGPEDGPLMILLHGFPEYAYGWRHQIPALATAGYCVWAPDQRGYNLSDKPRGMAAYAVDNLARDVVGLIAAAGRQHAIVVGHDWGAAVAWWMAARYARHVRSLIVLNVPHGQVMAAHLRHNARQVMRSWYMFFFQIPWLPERLLRLGNWALGVSALQKTSAPGTFTSEDLAHYKQAWSQPGAITAMLNWYRAAFQIASGSASIERIRVPTLLLWGEKDRFLGREMAKPSIERCDVGQLVMYEDASHWLHHEIPEEVNGAIVDFADDQVES